MTNLVGKVMSLLFNMLSRLVIAFLPRSKHLLISWLQSPSTVILEHPQNELSVSIVSSSICHDHDRLVGYEPSIHQRPAVPFSDAFSKKVTR